MTKTSDDKSQGMPEGLYCNAAICNGCGHVYMERPSSCDCGNDERINGFEPAAVFTAADLSTTTAPQADEWVKCVDRVPATSVWVSGLSDTGKVIPAMLVDNGDSVFFRTANDEISEGAIVAWQPLPAGPDMGGEK